jgi:hypothetical protein
MATQVDEETERTITALLERMAMLPPDITDECRRRHEAALEALGWRSA